MTKEGKNQWPSKSVGGRASESGVQAEMDQDGVESQKESMGESLGLG